MFSGKNPLPGVIIRILNGGHELTPTGEQHREITDEICRANFRRGSIYGAFMLLMEVVLIIFIDLKRIGPPGTSPAVNRYLTYFFLHIAIALLCLIILLLTALKFRYRDSPVLPWEKGLPGLFVSLILSLLAGIALMDVVGTGRTEVFISSMLIASILTIIGFPWNAILLSLPYGVFILGQDFLNLEPAVRLSLGVNGSVIYLACIAISTFSYGDYYINLLKNIQLREANDKLSHLATHDPLTGLPNRRYFEEQLQRELALVERSGKKGYLLLLDVDHFKRINDRYGHDTGDLVLSAIGETLRNSTRDIDLIARWGGEEFILYLPALTDSSGRTAAERLRLRFEENPLSSPVGTIPLTVSIGVSPVTPENGDNFDMVFKAADRALYLAKERGRNRVEEA